MDQIHNQCVVRNGDVVELCLLDNGPVYGINFGAAAVHDILRHGGEALLGVLADVMHHVQDLHVGEVSAVRFCNIDRLADHFFGKIPGVLIVNHGTDGRAGDGCKGVDGEIDKELAPDDALDVLGDFRMEAAFLQKIADDCKVCVLLQVAADGCGTVPAVANLSAAEINGVMLAGTDDDVLLVDVLCDLAVISGAVLQRHYQRLLPEESAVGAERVLGKGGFDKNDDEVSLFPVFPGKRRTDVIIDALGTVLFKNADAVLVDGIDLRLVAVQHDDVVVSA